MSDKRCPMCGKLNPEDAEVCKYCQARLKPLVAPTPPAKPDKSDEVDWLRDLAGNDKSAGGEPQAGAPDGEVPDWLSRIRQKTKEETDALSPIGRAPEVGPEMPGQETPPATRGQTTPPPADGSADNWLQSLRGAGAAQEEPSAPEPSASSPEDQDNDDWLRSFGARLDAIKTDGTAAAAAPADRQPPEAEEPTAEAQPARAEMPDWMKALSPLKKSQDEAPAAGAVPPEEGPAPAASEAAPLPEGNVPDWLKSFAAGPAPVETSQIPAEESAPAAPEAAPAPAEDVPEWLKTFAAAEPLAAETPLLPAEESAPAAPEAAPASEGDVPDWLKSFSAAEGPVVPEEGPVPAAFEAEAAPAPQGGVPDWSKSFAAEGPAAQATEPQAPSTQLPIPPSEETPDWLKSFAAAEPLAAETPLVPEEESAPAAPEAAPLPEGDVPDWLKSFAAEGPAAQAPNTQLPNTSLPSTSSTETPDWLKAFEAEHPAAVEPTGDSAPAFVEGEALPSEGIPDWLKAYVPPEAAAASSGPEAQPAEPAGEAPAWLKAYADHQAELEQQKEGGEAAPAGEPVSPEPESVSPFSEETLPDWLKTSQAAPEGEPVREEPASGLIGRSEDELAGPAHPLAGEEVPEWLAQKEEESAAQPEAASETTPDNLEMAQLPAWLQAMRPVESAAPATAEGPDEQRVEKSGPLAGLRGVVRAEDLVTQYQKPPVYSVKLHVSEPQTLRANLMEQVLGSETQSQAVPAEPTLAPQYVVKVVTALAMIALVLVVLFFGPRPLVPAALSQVDPQVTAVNSLVNSLPPGSPVLVAVDYQAPLSGELKIASQPVIQHLMVRQARLVFVATNPIGPVLAQDLFSTSLTNTGYKAELMANLGYLLGGSTALQMMSAPAGASSQHPLRDALPQTWSGDGSWNTQPALFGLNQIGDFKQVILLTDSVESARDWVEQVQPALAAKKVPLIVVSSAQAAPLLQAYQDSGQFAGLIGGLPGGASYEQIRQNRGTGTGYFNAYLAGILAAVLFILLGGVVSLVSNLASPKTKRKA